MSSLQHAPSSRAGVSVGLFPFRKLVDSERTSFTVVYRLGKANGRQKKSLVVVAHPQGKKLHPMLNSPDFHMP